MTTSIKNLLSKRQTDPGVVRVSLSESARVSQNNPGPGIPLSMLPPEMQQRLRDGEKVTEAELNDALQASQS